MVRGRCCIAGPDALSRLHRRYRNHTFHGYGPSGNVTAPLVYVNYGTVQDYDELQSMGIDVTGMIAIARYGSELLLPA